MNTQPDPSSESLESENAYWQSIGGRTEDITGKVGFSERFELMLEELNER